MHTQTTTAGAKTRPRAHQPIEAAAMPDALLTIDTVCALTGEGRSTIYGKIKTMGFPAQARKSRRFARWRAGDVTAYLRGEWSPA